MSKFLITGGAGFIGGNFLHYAMNKYPNDKYVCIDCLTYAGNMETIEDLLSNPNFKFVKEDITNREQVYKLFEQEKFDYVINFAAESHVDRSIESSEIFLKTNILGTQVLMDACRKYGIKRFHQVSTDEVYGDLPLNRKDLTFDESSKIKASNPYSASKAGADILAQSYFRTYKLPITISRCSNNYGPYQFPEKLIPLVIKKALADEKIPVYGTGQNVRDWIFVTDHCSGIDAIVRYGKDGEVYNIGAHGERSNLEVVKTILRVLEKPQNLISFVTDRPGHDLRYALNATKIEELGWKPRVTFEEGIRETIEWYLNNTKWMKSIESGEYLKWMERYEK